MTLGFYSGKPENGNVVSKQVSVKNVEDLTASVTASTGALTLTNVAVDNAGDLTFSATKGKVSVGKHVTFQNTGVVTVEAKEAGQNIDFAADYDGKTGYLNVSGAGAVNVTGNITGDYVKVGDVVKLKDGKPATETEKNTIGIKGDTIAIGTATNETDGVGSLVVGNTLEIAGNFANNTKVEAPATVVTADESANATVTNGTFATMSLGDLTIADAKGLTLANKNGKQAIQVGKLTLDGALTVSEGKTVIAGAGSKIDKGTLTIGAASTSGAVTLSGDLTNNAKIAFNSADDTLTVDGALDNTKTATLGSDQAKGKVLVNGSLTNKNAVTVKDIEVSGKLLNQLSEAAGDQYTGKVTADALTVKKGGVVESAIDTKKQNYVVKTTVVEEGGAFVTKLNGTVASSTTDNALTGFGTFELNGGVLGTAADAQITNFALSANDSLTLNGKYDLNTVEAAADGTLIVGDEGVVSVQSLSTKQAGAVDVEDGTLSTSLKAVNAKTDEKGDVVAVENKSISVAKQTFELSQDATLLLDVGADKVSKAGVTTIQGWVSNNSNGLIDLGNVAIEDLAATNGEIAVSKLNGLDGITTDTLKSSRITEITDAITKTASYGAVELKGKAEGKGDLEIGTDTTGATLTLNGLGDTPVNLVQYSDDKVAGVKLKFDTSTLVTKGNGVVGAVTGATGVLNAADKTLTVQGNVDVADVEIGKTATLVIGESEDASKPYTVDAKYLTVDGNFDASANTVTVTKLFDVSGVADIKELALSAQGDVTGSVTVGKLTVQGADAVLNVGSWYVQTKDEDHAGTVAVTEFASGTIDASKSYYDATEKTYSNWTAPASSIAVKSATADTTIVVEQNAYVALGTTDTTAAQKALNAAGFTLAQTVDADPTDDVEVNSIDTRTVNSVVYVDGGKTAATEARAAASEAKAYLGSVNTAGDAQTGIVIAKNSALVFDAETVDTTGNIALFGQDLDIDHDAVVLANNIKVGDKVLLTAGDLNPNSSGYDWENLQFTGDILSYADVDSKNVLSVSMYEKSDLQDLYGLDSSIAGFDASYDYFANGNRGAATTSSAKFAEWLYTRSTSAGYGAYSDGTNDVKGEVIKSIANAAGALGATTGVQTLTMDAVAQMADTVADRTSVLTQRGQGVNVWADVNGGKFEAKTLFDGAGYSSDIYSGVLGLDYQFSCNAVLGAALTIGTADTDSKNSAFKASTDSDLVGFSVYASKTFADIWNVSADIGYLQASNEVKADGYGFNYKFDQDTDAFTVGVRGEVLTKAGSVNIVPHVGLRYTALSTDGFEAAYVTDIDDQNIFQMPVGVTVSTDFETSGWTIAPKFDLSVVPTFGDKDADLKLGVTGASATSDYAVRVIDSNPVQAQLGINATNGAWGFGLNYKLGVGSEDRMNNSFNANVRYAF